MQEQKDPLVSVVMPVYNAEAFLAESIESVLAQNYRHFELVVVDDGSTDRSAEIVNGFRDGRIRYYRQQNGGVSKARNKGVQLSQAGLIAFLDSDDCWHPDKLEKQVNYLQSHNEVGGVYCWFQVFSPGKPRRICVLHVNNNPYGIISDGYGLLPSATLLRRDVFEKSGGFDEEFVGSEFEDLELTVRLSEIASFGCVSEPLTVYRSPERKVGIADREASARYLHNRGLYLQKCLARYQHDPAVTRALNHRLVGHWSDLGKAMLIDGQTSEGRKFLLKAIRSSLKIRINAKMLVRACWRLQKSLFLGVNGSSMPTGTRSTSALTRPYAEDDG